MPPTMGATLLVGVVLLAGCSGPAEAVDRRASPLDGAALPADDPTLPTATAPSSVPVAGGGLGLTTGDDGPSARVPGTEAAASQSLDVSTPGAAAKDVDAGPAGSVNDRGAAAPPLGYPDGSPARLEKKALTSKAQPGQTLSYTVYVPPGYDTMRNQRYPVLFHLHGCGYDPFIGDNRAGLEAGMRDKVVWPMLMVFPQMVKAGTKCQAWWRDGDDGRAYEKMLLSELIPTIEATYRTLPGRQYRFIQGMSAGGAAAIRLAAKRPQLFSVCVNYDPPLSATGLKPNDDPKDTVDNWVKVNADQIRARLALRGVSAELAAMTKAFRAELASLMIAYDYVEHPECMHNFGCLMKAEGNRSWQFLVKNARP